MTILLFNAGSSSLKATVMNEADGTVLARGMGDWAGNLTRYHFRGPDGAEHAEDVAWRGHASTVARFVADLSAEQRSVLTAVGHRVVHGGPFTSPVRITPEVQSRIATLADLAPLHNPPSLEALSAAQEQLPDVPHVAVFDTAFHATIPPESYTYPVPSSWARDWGIRRFGFHGLSHAYCTRRGEEMLRQQVLKACIVYRNLDDLRLVSCHLGHGCSASAVRGGKCVDTTMGFTPLEGLMMATRSGSIDPGVVLRVQQDHGLSAAQVESILNRESGLLGVSGVSADMRQVLAAAHEGNDQARLALGIYTHRVRQAIGALTVTLGGIDALIFTAGVGEHAGQVRSMICAGLECLGVQLDSRLNTECQPDADIARRDSPARIFVIATREDIAMLDEVTRVLQR